MTNTESRNQTSTVPTSDILSNPILPHPPVNARNWTLQDIATLVNGTIEGDPTALITGVASIGEAEAGDLVFAEADKYVGLALLSHASAILIRQDAPLAQVVQYLSAQPGVKPPTAIKPVVRVPEPRHAFVTILESFAPRLAPTPGVHATAQIGEDPQFGQDIFIAAQATIGSDVTLGDRVVIMSGVRIGDGCRIGSNTVLYPNVVLYPGVHIGCGCLLHAGCVIGADGYGYVQIGQTLRKVPHLGTVEIGDGVEIGANSCIDRAKTGATTIGSGTKIDNLVHVAHNVRIGQSCLLIAQVGIAGSVTIGNGVTLAGQVGIGDHITLGDGARVGAQGGVIGNVAAGETVSGYPARPHRQKMREYAAMASLPKTMDRVRALEKKLAALEAQIETT